MRFNYKKCLCAALACAFLLSGCEEERPVPSEITVSGNDNSSEERQPFPVECCGVKLDEAVKKAVSLSPAATEIICEEGFESRLVGVSDYCDYPENLSLPKFGSTENPDIDGIIKLKPDAVFTLSMLSEREIYKLNQAGIKVLTANAPANIEEYYSLYKEIASAFYGNEAENEQKDETKSERIGKNARSALENASKAVNIGTFIYVTEKLTTAGTDTFESAVLSLSGENLCKSDGYSPAESCSGLYPDYIVVSDELSYDTLANNEIFSVMIYNGAKVRFVNSARFERPSARTAEIFEKIAE